MPLRRLAIPAVVVALGAAVPAHAGAATVRSARVHRAIAALHRAQAIGRGIGVRTGFELTPALRELFVRYRDLPRRDRRVAGRILLRPTDGAGDPEGGGYTAPEAAGSPYCTPHFCVHWVASSADAPDLTDANGNGTPDWVETVGATAEHVYSVENGELGWRTPKPDAGLGGDDRTDIYLKQLGGTGIYGYTAPDRGQSTTSTDHSAFAYLVIDNDFQKNEFPRYSTPIDPLDVTLAHEYNHVLQFSYDVFEDTWFAESTAVWMEGKVYDPVHDYLQYLPGWVGLSTQPITQFNGTDPNDRRNVKVYGSSVFSKWLDAHYGADVIRLAWQDSTAAQSFAPAAYDAALRGRGTSFADTLDRFSAATPEWQTSPADFPEGSLYPDVARTGSLSIDGAAARPTLDHAAYALYDVAPRSLGRVKLVGSAPKGVSSAFALVGRVGAVGTGTVTTQVTELPRGGTTQVVLSDPGRFSRLTAVLINSDTTQTGFSNLLQDYRYTHDHEPFTATVTSDFTSPRPRSRSPRPGAHAPDRTRISVSFSEAVTGVTRRSFTLIGPGGRTVRARLSFHSGSRKAVLTPSKRLRSGARYRVRLTRSITDTSLNPLRTTGWTFRAR